jgi:hypothetical protein
MNTPNINSSKTKRAYRAYRSSQGLVDSRPTPQARIHPSDGVSRDMWASRLERPDGLPVLTLAEFTALHNIDRYEREPEAGKPNRLPAIDPTLPPLGGEHVGPLAVATIRLMLRGVVPHCNAKAAILEIASKWPAQPTEEFICDYYDIRPEWLRRILEETHREQFVFGLDLA